MLTRVRRDLKTIDFFLFNWIIVPARGYRKCVCASTSSDFWLLLFRNSIYFEMVSVRPAATFGHSRLLLIAVLRPRSSINKHSAYWRWLFWFLQSWFQQTWWQRILSEHLAPFALLEAAFFVFSSLQVKSKHGQQVFHTGKKSRENSGWKVNFLQLMARN